ncbi:MAG: hypothetical protein SGI71_11020 [Verrucomicrobiota bacterium]|nr:hypothetical protein [Verrucomicrobiota bacterium]
MPFFVIGEDNQKYGPASELTIQQWLREGRIGEETVLEEKDSGERRKARAWEFLAEIFTPTEDTTKAKWKDQFNFVSKTGKIAFEPCLRYVWGLYLKNFLALSGTAFLIVAVAIGILGPCFFVLYKIRNIGPLLCEFVFFSLTFGFSGYLLTNLFKMSLDAVDGKKVRLQELWDRPEWLHRSTSAGFLAGAAIGAASLLFCFPAIPVMVLLFPGFILLADRKERVPMDAFKQGLELVKDNFGNLWPLLLAAAIGIMCSMGVGLVFVLPLITLMLSMAYRTINEPDEPEE